MAGANGKPPQVRPSTTTLAATKMAWVLKATAMAEGAVVNYKFTPAIDGE